MSKKNELVEVENTDVKVVEVRETEKKESKLGTIKNTVVNGFKKHKKKIIAGAAITTVCGIGLLVKNAVSRGDDYDELFDVIYLDSEESDSEDKTVTDEN